MIKAILGFALLGFGLMQAGKLGFFLLNQPSDLAVTAGVAVLALALYFAYLIFGRILRSL